MTMPSCRSIDAGHVPCSLFRAPTVSVTIAHDCPGTRYTTSDALKHCASVFIPLDGRSGVKAAAEPDWGHMEGMHWGEFDV